MTWAPCVGMTVASRWSSEVKEGGVGGSMFHADWRSAAPSPGFFFVGGSQPLKIADADLDV